MSCGMVKCVYWSFGSPFLVKICSCLSSILLQCCFLFLINLWGFFLYLDTNPLSVICIENMLS